MRYNDLGNTGIKVSEIGLGTEYLLRQPKEIVIEVFRKAIKAGINYIDILFSVQKYLENLSTAIIGHREDIVITGHLGTRELEGSPRKTRDVLESKDSFLKLLSILQIEHVDILIIQFVTLTEYDNIISPNNLLDLALSFQKEGKANYIGISTHDISVAMKAIESQKFDVLMFPINIANHQLKERESLLKKCLTSKIGLIAIKPFAGGKLLQKNQTVYFAKYQTAGLNFKKKVPSDINSIKCLNYVTSLAGVNLSLMGVKNNAELQENLLYLNTSIIEKDFKSLIQTFLN